MTCGMTVPVMLDQGCRESIAGCNMTGTVVLHIGIVVGAA